MSRRGSSRAAPGSSAGCTPAGVVQRGVHQLFLSMLSQEQALATPPPRQQSCRATPASTARPKPSRHVKARLPPCVPAPPHGCAPQSRAAGWRRAAPPSPTPDGQKQQRVESRHEAKYDTFPAKYRDVSYANRKLPSQVCLTHHTVMGMVAGSRGPKRSGQATPQHPGTAAQRMEPRLSSSPAQKQPG